MTRTINIPGMADFFEEETSSYRLWYSLVQMHCSPWYFLVDFVVCFVLNFEWEQIDNCNEKRERAHLKPRPPRALTVNGNRKGHCSVDLLTLLVGSFESKSEG